MTPDQIRTALDTFRKNRGLKIADWCRRARLEPSTLYDFLNHKTKDLSALKLIALADAENVPLDALVGRAALPKGEILSKVQPVLDVTGAMLTLEQVAERSGLKATDLTFHWPDLTSLIVDCYLRQIRDALPLHMAEGAGLPLIDRLMVIVRASAAWLIDRSELFLAFHSLIVQAPAHHRAGFDTARAELANALKTQVLDPSADLVPLPDDSKLTIADNLMTLGRDIMVNEIRSRDLEKIERRAFKLTQALLTAKTWT